MSTIHNFVVSEEKHEDARPKAKMIPQDDEKLRGTCALPERGEAEKGQDNATAELVMRRTEVAVSRPRLYLSTGLLSTCVRAT